MSPKINIIILIIVGLIALSAEFYAYRYYTYQIDLTVQAAAKGAVQIMNNRE